jgi:hypothetical protein|tara:strand:+ start:1736 stop:1945 length:210 start_codon:yes stop_codon:yes gene_type:complete
MIRAIYFALNFVMIFLGVVLAIYFDLYIGLSVIALFTFKFFLQLPSTESNRRLDESFKKAKQMEFKFDK